MKKSILKLSLTFIILFLIAYPVYPSARDREDIQKFKQYIEEGKRHFDNFDYSGALDKWTEAHNIDPWNEEVKRLIEKALENIEELNQKVYEGFRFINEGKVDKAYNTFLFVKNRSSPEDSGLYRLLDSGFGKVNEIKKDAFSKRILESGNEYLDKERLERISLLENRIRREELIQKILNLRQEGVALFEKDDYEGSRERWHELLELKPDDEEAGHYLSKIEFRERERDRLLSIAKGYFDSGIIFYHEERYEEAIDQFENAIAVEYNIQESREYIEEIENAIIERETERLLSIAKNYFDSGIIFYHEERYEEAIDQFENAIAVEYNIQESKEYIGEINNILMKILNLRQEGVALFEKDDYEGSRERWHELLELKPDDEEAGHYLSKIEFRERERDRLLAIAKGYFDSGIIFYHEERYEEAIDQFENAIAVKYNIQESKEYLKKIKDIKREEQRLERERMTEQVAGYLREGIKYYNLSQFKRSIGVLNEGLEFDPENTQIKEYIVRDILALKREEERFVPRTSPFYKLIQNLGMLGIDAYDRKDYEEAVKYYEEILLIFPFNENARLNLTKSLSKTDPNLVQDILMIMYGEAKELIDNDKKREATIKLKLILEINPNFKDAKNILKELERKEESQEKQVTETDKKRAKELHTRGLELYKDEKLEEAIRIWKRAVELNPEFVEARVFLSRAETKLRNLEKYGAGVNEVVEARNEELRIKIKRHYLEGINFFMSGLYKEAITEWEEVLKIDPKNENVKMNIERAKKRLGFEGSS